MRDPYTKAERDEAYTLLSGWACYRMTGKYDGEDTWTGRECERTPVQEFAISAFYAAGFHHDTRLCWAEAASMVANGWYPGAPEGVY